MSTVIDRIKIDVYAISDNFNLIIAFLTHTYFLIGAYGEVRKCLHKETKALRAVKIINKKCLAEDEKQKLLNEIDILK